MARRLRLSLPELPVHIVHRGNNRQRVFYTENDYWFYLHQLNELLPASGCALHAYVLMPNHVHLLATPNQKGGTSLLMKHLAQRHAQFINRMRRRSGSLWEGRFYSNAVEGGRYLFNCYRYIELNPVRAGLAQHPSEYRWSSHLINAEGTPSGMVTPHPQFTGLADTSADRRAAYRALFGTALSEEELVAIRTAARSCTALGSEEFRDRLAHAWGAPAWGPMWGQTPGSDPGV